MARGALATVGELAADQWGLLSTAQAREHGISGTVLGRMVDQGVLHRVAYGVYATPTALADPLLDLRAAWLALDPATPAYQRLDDPTTGVISHASAAHLHELGDLTHDVHHFILPRRHQTRREDVRTHRAEITADDITIVDGLPATTVTRTIGDLVAAGHDMDHIGHIVRDAMWAEKTTTAGLHTHLSQRHGEERGRELTDELLSLAHLDHRQVAEQVAQLPAVQTLARAMALEFLRAVPSEHLERLQKQLAGATAPTLDLTKWFPADIRPAALGNMRGFQRNLGFTIRPLTMTDLGIAPIKLASLWQQLNPDKADEEASVPVPSPDKPRDEQ